MNDKNTAGIDLDNVKNLPRPDLRHHGEYRRGYSAAISDVIDLARRAEPSVTAGDERALFEAWAQASAIREDLGAWEAWQARAGLASPAVPEGYKLVPIEPTQEMIDNIAAFVDGHENDAEVIYRAMVAAAPAVSQKDGAAVECGMCNDSGIVGFPPDQYEECPDCIKARAATTASASIDTAEFRKLSYAYAEALFKGTVPQTSVAWGALVEHVDGRAQAPSRDAAPDAQALLLEAATFLDNSMFQSLGQAGRAEELSARIRAALANSGASHASNAGEDTERDAVDAARYRFLRVADLDAIAAGHWQTGRVIDGVKFDDAIDAAIATSTKEKK